MCRPRSTPVVFIFLYARTLEFHERGYPPADMKRTDLIGLIYPAVPLWNGSKQICFSHPIIVASWMSPVD